MPRLQCCVPFCRRTTANKHGWGEWVCGKHWAAVPKEKRRAWLRLGREVRSAIALEPLTREYWKLPPGSPKRIAAVRMWHRYDRIWNRVKRIAIERAGGI